MEPDETILISGRIIAEFEDEADPILAEEAERARALERMPVAPAINPIPSSNTQPKPS
jgi:hypothetical protein